MTKEWLKAAGIRALKTMAQTALSMMTVGMVLEEINWLKVISASILSGIYSLLTSIKGLPELNQPDTLSEAFHDENGGPINYLSVTDIDGNTWYAELEKTDNAAVADTEAEVETPEE